jgi:hypothetical protein
VNINIDLNNLCGISWDVLGTTLFGSQEGIVIRIYDKKNKWTKIADNKSNGCLKLLKHME